MPINSINELSLISALAAPIDQKECSEYSELFDEPFPNRDALIKELIESVSSSSLKYFAQEFEKHNDCNRICLTFKQFLINFSQRFQTPILFNEVGFTTGHRIIQALFTKSKTIKIDELMNYIVWMNEIELHNLIRDGITKKLYKCKIDMKNNCINLI